MAGNYGYNDQNVLEIDINGFCCVHERDARASRGFEPFFKARPLKILRNEPAIEYEIKLEFETFFKANKEEKITILNNEFLNQSKEILSDNKVKKIDTDAFINDIKECLNKN